MDSSVSFMLKISVMYITSPTPPSSYNFHNRSVKVLRRNDTLQLGCLLKRIPSPRDHTYNHTVMSSSEDFRTIIEQYCTVSDELAQAAAKLKDRRKLKNELTHVIIERMVQDELDEIQLADMGSLQLRQTKRNKPLTEDDLKTALVQNGGVEVTRAEHLASSILNTRTESKPSLKRKKKNSPAGEDGDEGNGA